ncbi:ThuA domain-containing protein [Candidatus Neomarinimicrobiota bacterium]
MYIVNTKRTRFMKLSTLVFMTCLGLLVQAEARNINVLILQFFDSHDMRYQAEIYEQVLNATGDYDAEVMIIPEDQNWEDIDIRFADYQLIISSYLGQEMPDRIKDEFDQYMSDGGNLVIVHQGVLSLEGWSKFHEMIGLGWYKAGAGQHIFWDNNDKKWIETPPYHGVGPGHGKQHEFVINVRHEDHTITRDMPKEWIHGMDEFYHGLRGPAKNIEILATSFSDKRTWGSGDHEPIAWTVKYGKGRIFVTVLGHAFLEEKADVVEGVDHYENETKAVHCVGFQTLFARGAEWAATGKVTTNIPKNFPKKASSVVVPPNEVKWRN